jgi:hypothetical protein
MPRSIRLVLVGTVTVVLAVAAGFVALRLVSPDRPARSAPPLPGSAGPVPHGTAQFPARADGPLIPSSGAYLGAYVQSSVFTPPAEIQAFKTFQDQLGMPLEIGHVYYPWGSKFPSAVNKYFVDNGKILLLTWGGSPDTKAIIAGRDDAMIRATAEDVKALGHPIMMEFRHEMDRPNLQFTIHGPADYIAAWDHVRAIFTAVGATNVSWVWCPTSQGFQSGRAQPFYPGNNEVDWVCADAYSTSTSQPLSQAAAAFLRWASHHDKPVIIGEFAVAGDPPGWPAWLAAAGRLVKTDPQIKAMVYFDANGIDSSGDAYQYWLGDHPAAMAAFATLARQPYLRAVAPHDP